MAFKNAITGSLIDPANQRSELKGESRQTITLSLNKEDFGLLYAAVMITEENEIITIGSSALINRPKSL